MTNDSVRKLGDARGAVMVEFLIAYLPVLFTFLAFWQLGELLVAQMVVERASSAAGRAAIVVLPDDPAFYEGELANEYQGLRKREIKLAAGLVLAASPHLSENFDVELDGLPDGNAASPLTVTVSAEFRCKRLTFVCGTDGLVRLRSTSQHTFHSASYEYEPVDPSATVQAAVDTDAPGCSEDDPDGSGGRGRGLGGATGTGGSGGSGGTRDRGLGGSGGSGGASKCGRGHTLDADGECKCPANQHEGKPSPVPRECAAGPSCQQLESQEDANRCKADGVDLASSLVPGIRNQSRESEKKAYLEKLKKIRDQQKLCCTNAQNNSGQPEVQNQCYPNQPGPSTTPDPNPVTACTPNGGHACTFDKKHLLDTILDDCKQRFGTNLPDVPFYRSQGGQVPQASWEMLSDDNGDLGKTGLGGAFCISSENDAHVKYFNNLRDYQRWQLQHQSTPPTGPDTTLTIVQWKMPGWFNECMKLIDMKQTGAKSCDSIEGLLPKRVDPHQPGGDTKWETDKLWVDAFIDNAIPKSVSTCVTTPGNDPPKNPHDKPPASRPKGWRPEWPWPVPEGWKPPGAPDNWKPPKNGGH